MIEQFRSKPIPIASAEEPFRMVALPQSPTFRCTAANDALGQLRTHAPQQDFRRSFNSIEAEQGASRPESCSAASAQLIFFERAEENARHQS